MFKQAGKILLAVAQKTERACLKYKYIFNVRFFVTGTGSSSKRNTEVDTSSFSDSSAQSFPRMTFRISARSTALPSLTGARLVSLPACSLPLTPACPGDDDALIPRNSDIIITGFFNCQQLCLCLSVVFSCMCQLFIRLSVILSLYDISIFSGYIQFCLG